MILYFILLVLIVAAYLTYRQLRGECKIEDAFHELRENELDKIVDKIRELNDEKDA